MPTFRLACQVTVSAYTAIEAATLDEAIAASVTRPVELAGGACGKDSHWIIEDADGSPNDIEKDDDF